MSKIQTIGVFLFAILAKLHPARNHPERITHYWRFQNELNMKDIDFPVKITDIAKFEKQNQDISINVFGYEDETLQC